MPPTEKPCCGSFYANKQRIKSIQNPNVIPFGQYQRTVAVSITKSLAHEKAAIRIAREL